MTCHVDEKTVNEVYQNCVLDYRKQFDCSVAMQLVKEGKTRNDCEHWRGAKVLVQAISKKGKK